MTGEGREDAKMARVRTKRFEKDGKTRERYWQLVWFARQYDELKRRERAWRAGDTDRSMAGDAMYSGRPDPTAQEGMRLASSPFAWKIAAIEQAAVAAAPAYSAHVLMSATRGCTWEELGPPCGRNQFLAARRRFFDELDVRVP